MLFFNPKLLLNSVKQWVTDSTGNLEAISPNPSIALIIFTFLEIKKHHILLSNAEKFDNSKTVKEFFLLQCTFIHTIMDMYPIPL